MSKKQKRIILVADLIDKGYDSRSVIEFIYNNMEWFYMVKGNHENFVYRFLKYIDYSKMLSEKENGQEVDEAELAILEKHVIKSKDLPLQDVIDTYFDSIELFKADEELKQKFYEVYDNMKPFLKTNSFIVTHAPCKDKYLGKLGASAERNQRTIVYPKREDYKTPQKYVDAKSNFFSFFRNQASRSLPFHLFGHVSSKGIGKLSNKINLDSGCVSGGQLSSIIINPAGRNLSRKVSARNNDKIGRENLFEFFYVPPAKISIDTLEGKEKRRILFAAEEKVNFISGTICPADKVMKKDENKKVILDESELESLDKGIEYFRRKGVKKIIAQPKYMGSRANVYLFSDSLKNYTTTRSGYLIKPNFIDLTDAYKPLYELPFIKEAFSSGTELLILDAELLPWSAIGKGLINKNFVTVGKGMSSEIAFLKENGFEDALNDIVEGPYKDCDFERASFNTSRKELVDTLGSNAEKTFGCIKKYIREFPSLDTLDELSKVYSEQVELYGIDGDAYFKLFSILKQVFNNGTEKLFFDESNEDIYKAINSDNYIVVDLDNPEDIKKLKAFYNTTTIDENMEGIMIKPLMVYVKGVVPAMKIRNSRYLTIIYGPDYQMETKLTKLIERRRINRKLEISIKEWEIGKRLLEIPYNLIGEDNEHYIQACGEMVVEERKEKELDPRL